jgi:tRNA1(Val) A37 N6-methylase TrmN6
MAEDELTEDRLLGGRVRLTQRAHGFRAGLDAVFLAAAVPAKAGDKVLDVGAGNGAASLCLASRIAGVFVTGLDSDRALVRLAGTNADANGLSGRVQFFFGDLQAPPTRLAPASFDHVMVNPPFRPPGSGTPPADAGKVAATFEDRAALDDWLKFCLLMTRHHGTITLIYTAERLDALIAALHGKLGSLVVIPLWPGGSDNRAARRVLVNGRRGSSGPMTLSPGIVLHRPDGTYTEAAEDILRRGMALAW